MSGYGVYVTPGAWEEMKALPGHMRQRVKRAIDSLGGTPRLPQSKQLRTSGSGVELRRSRVGRWRLIYAVDDALKLIYVLAIRRRPPYRYDDLDELQRQIVS